MIICLGSVQLLAMEEQPPKNLYDLDANCVRTICHYLTHRDCLHVRLTYRRLNNIWWYSYDPIHVHPDADAKLVWEGFFWEMLLAKIKAIEAKITRLEHAINPKQIDIPNAIILHLGPFLNCLIWPEEFAKTAYIRSLNLYSVVLRVNNGLARLPRLLPFLIALNLENTKGPYFPKEFGNWMSLRFLSLAHSPDIKRGLEKYCPPNIQRLNISCCSYRRVPLFLKNLPQLTHLNLSGNHIDFLSLARLPKLAPQLIELDLSFNELADFPVAQFAQRTCLRRLNLCGNLLHLSACLEKMATALTHLSYLHLGQNNLSLIDLQNLSQCKSLNSLHLGNHKNGSGFGVFRNNVFSDEEEEIIRNWFAQTKVDFLF